MEEFPVLFGHRPGKQTRKQAPRGRPWLSERILLGSVKEEEGVEVGRAAPETRSTV